MTLYLPRDVVLGSPRRYVGSQGARYEPPANRRYTNVSVLPELIGLTWGDDALKLVHAARPSMIRVVSGEETTDAVLWRVTIHVDGKMVIDRATQEAEVGA
jgi:hypothetical protein